MGPGGTSGPPAAICDLRFGHHCEFTEEGFAEPYVGAAAERLWGALAQRAAPLAELRRVELAGAGAGRVGALAAAWFTLGARGAAPGAAARLRRLDLSSCRWVDDLTACTVAEAAPGLEDVNLCCTSVGDATPAALAQYCAGLRDVNFGCTRVTAAGVARIAAGCVELSGFDVCYARGVTHDPAAAAAVVALCAARGGAMRFLGVGGCEALRDADLLRIAQTCPGVRHVGLGGCQGLTAGGVVAAASRLPALQMLDLHRCDGFAAPFAHADLAELLRAAPKLRRLGLKDVEPSPALSARVLSALRRLYTYGEPYDTDLIKDF